VRAVHVGGVDKRHALGDDLAQQRDALVVVRVLAPDLRAGELHRAVADVPHGEVAADGDGAGDVVVGAHASSLKVSGVVQRTV
jgi:hypothetical protein